jgi:hypothetical protein
MGGWQTPMTDSIFNCGAMDYSMMNVGMPGMFPSFTGNGMTDYAKQMTEYQKYMFDNNLEQGKKTKEADLEVNGPVRGIENNIAILKATVNAKEREKILPAFENLKKSVKVLYPEASDERIHSEALKVYEAGNKDTTGRTESLMDHINRVSDGSLVEGFWGGLTLGLGDTKTSAENVAGITGLNVSKTDNVEKTAGNVVGGALGITGAIVTVKGAKHLWKILPNGGRWALLAAAAGAIGAFFINRNK